LSGNRYTTAPITADCAVQASFAIITHTVTAQAGNGGSITPPGAQTVEDGVTATFQVSADAGHVVAKVAGCGGHLDGTTYTTAAIGADCTVVATFAAGDVVFADGFDGTPP
jgi:hypothetical protein